MNDDELERIKRKRLEKMQRILLLKELEAKEGTKEEDEKPREPTNREILDRYFKERAWEVWNEAQRQYPQVMPRLEQLLVDAVKEKKIQEYLDGASLMGFFRQIGLPVRLQTKIRISEHGELKTLEQKIKENRD
jgi:DNA-binding TFAR19-related protein (PDSD5 family)